MLNLSNIHVDVDAGIDLETGIRDCIELAKITRSTVHFSFNGVKLYADRDSDLQIIVTVYQYLLK